MSFKDKFKPFIKGLKVCSLVGSGVIFIAYHVSRTYRSIDRIINPCALDCEHKYTPEYIYIDDPAYGVTLKMEQDKENRSGVSLARVWKSVQHSLAWKLLWLCRHGNREQRNIALDQLAAFKSNKHWDCIKIAQALDQNTAVLLARTRGADLRYFLPPPIHVRRAALSPELLSFKFRDMIHAVQIINPHSCIQHFLYKHFVNIQEQVTEADTIPAKPDSISERDLCVLCLDALHHHISLFNSKVYAQDTSALTLLKMGLLPRLAELLMRYHNDAELDLAVVRILTVLSLHVDLLTDFFQNGLIRELSRLIKSKDVRLASSAAVCLANLTGEFCYRPGLFLLYPLYRTRQPHTCDTLLIHGLRGGVFVTWRQRDKKHAEPIGLMDVTISNVNSESCTDKADTYIDPELKQVMEDIIELEEEALLSDFDVILHDLPLESKRDKISSQHTALNKREALKREAEDRCNYTFCWPKDWLPNDCRNLRIIGINYWSSLSEWVGNCPRQTANIESRASDLAPNLIDAGVGKKDTPVVWLAHSMGGIIVKQILTDGAKTDNTVFKNLCENTKAVLFFSTPHKGSTLATMPRAAAAILWPTSDVRQLQVNSPVLLELHKAFIHFADHYGWETISFAETLPTLITSFKVPVHFVEASSADLGRGVFYKLPLDHLSICKPATRDSLLYTTVLDVLQRVASKDIEMTYSSEISFWIMNLWWWATRNMTNGVLSSLEETQDNEDLQWFQQFILTSTEL